MVFSVFGGCLACLLASAGQLPVTDRDIQAARALMNMGLWRRGDRGTPNHELATGARATTLGLKEIADRLERRLAAVKSPEEYDRLAAEMVGLRVWRPTIGRLRDVTIHRRWELASMGVDVDALLALQQESIRRVLAVDSQVNGPFVDVPRNHWAFSAVEDLRKAGIAVGYLDGSFQGGTPRRIE